MMQSTHRGKTPNYMQDSGIRPLHFRGRRNVVVADGVRMGGNWKTRTWTFRRSFSFCCAHWERDGIIGDMHALGERWGLRGDGTLGMRKYESIFVEFTGTRRCRVVIWMKWYGGRRRQWRTRQNWTTRRTSTRFYIKHRKRERALCDMRKLVR